MSRTFNTDPYPIQARRRGGEVHHRCELSGLAQFAGVPCDLDRYDPSPPRGTRWRSCRRWVDVYGGRRRTQSEWATRRGRAHRARVRARLRVASRVANAALADGAVTLDELAELDCADRPRSIVWDLPLW